MRISDWSSDVCSSDLLERKDGRWQEFQVLGGRMGYNWHHFKIDDHHFLGYADQASPSLIYRWDGAKFVPYQTRSEEHTSELQSLMRISYAVFCLKKKNTQDNTNNNRYNNITHPINIHVHYDYQ